MFKGVNEMKRVVPNNYMRSNLLEYKCREIENGQKNATEQGTLNSA
jgi:hypothetical protein